MKCCEYAPWYLYLHGSWTQQKHFKNETKCKSTLSLCWVRPFYCYAECSGPVFSALLLQGRYGTKHFCMKNPIIFFRNGRRPRSLRCESSWPRVAATSSTGVTWRTTTTGTNVINLFLCSYTQPMCFHLTTPRLYL